MHAQPHLGANWMESLTYSGQGIAATPHNAQVILQHEPDWKDVLQFDEFAQRVVFVKDPPMHEYAPRSLSPADQDKVLPTHRLRLQGREVTDEDASRAAFWIERKWKTKMSAASVSEALNVVARTRSVHPVRQYLNSLVWDGVPRLGKPNRPAGTLGPDDPGEAGETSWLTTWMGADNNDYTCMIGRMVPIGLCARAFRPGCAFQNMMILEGSQGIGKSRALRALGDPWFSENLPDISSKDALQQLSGVWLMEVPEMNAILKGGVNAAKDFLSKSVDRYRAPYGRRVQDFPRQIGFIATTNQTVYLIDSTGNRRFWPVYTRDVSVDGITDNRDQLFAEAMMAFRAGEPWWPDPTIVPYLTHQQNLRVEQDAWHVPTSQWLQKQGSRGVTTADLLTALGLDKARWDPAAERRASRLLLQLGYTRHERRVEGIHCYVYDPPNVPSTPPEPPPPPPVPELPTQLSAFDDEEKWRF